MGKIELTEEQKQVVAHRKGNLLVAAAAGAGKTAVLVERIMGRLLDPEDPAGLDELLIVTFTRAAAAEMRERIGKAIEERLFSETEENAGSLVVKRLTKQYALLSEAKISTIDSFCKTVVTENFQKTDFDPAFRIADEAELGVLKEEVLDVLLEEKYEEGAEDFLALSEYFDRGKRDTMLGAVLLRLSAFSESFPDREGWFDAEIGRLSGGLFSKEKEEIFFSMFRGIMEAVRELNEKAIRLSEGPGGPLQYKAALLSDRELIVDLLSASKMEKLFSVFRNGISFQTLSRAKPKAPDGTPLFVEEDIKKKVQKDLRDVYKKTINDLAADYFYEDMETVEEEEKEIGKTLIFALKLAKEYSLRFAEEKKKKNIVDFSDLMHAALSILRDKEGRPTETAKEYREQFKEIMIDEYQDSNLLQEVLLTSISREEDGDPNVFMVGDVKQSIYKFRQARPELFLEKYEKYLDMGTYRKIGLHKNFRSGGMVIATVNEVFREIMRKEAGGIRYGTEEELVQGRTEALIRPENRTEILLMDKEKGEDREADLTDMELEALMIAKKMKKLKEAGTPYNDMVILLRTMKDWSESFKKVLLAEGIPAVSETSTGYFSAWEVLLMLSYLQIIDNPRQDIPLTAVLLSEIGGFSEEELSEIRIHAGEEADMWEALLCSESEKGKTFLKNLNEKRKEAVYTPTHELLKKLYEETGFYHYASAMPGGEVRKANLDMLVLRARDFETTSLHGVTHFVKYIEKLRSYEVDFGEAATEDVTGAVKIMSIHKSKGLEFPVVFVSGLSKVRNDMDARENLVIHPDLGIAAGSFNKETREKYNGFMKKLIAEKIKTDNIAEEIRVLYVALTRAREKLILTGLLSKAEEKLSEMKEVFYEAGEAERLFLLLKARNFLSLLLPPLLLADPDIVSVPQIIGLSDLLKAGAEEVEKGSEKKRRDVESLSLLPTGEEKKFIDVIEKELHYRYPYEEAIAEKLTTTVSELKRLHFSKDEAEEEDFKKKDMTGLPMDDLTPYLPSFMKEEGEAEDLTGGKRGTLLHRLLSKLRFDKDYDKKSLAEEVKKLDKRAQVTERDERELLKFLTSELAGRMKEAFLREDLFRETAFTLGVEKEVAGVPETLIVQGMIDAWFEEDGEIVLVDYKTDRVAFGNGEEMLKERYEIQLRYYKEALERVTGKKVKESLIYSLSMGKTLKVE